MPTFNSFTFQNNLLSPLHVNRTIWLWWYMYMYEKHTTRNLNWINIIITDNEKWISQWNLHLNKTQDKVRQTTPNILTLCGKTNDSPQQQGGIFALISVDAFCWCYCAMSSERLSYPPLLLSLKIWYDKIHQSNDTHFMNI